MMLNASHAAITLQRQMVLNNWEYRLEDILSGLPVMYGDSGIVAKRSSCHPMTAAAVRDCLDRCTSPGSISSAVDSRLGVHCHVSETAMSWVGHANRLFEYG